jgi:hypothetical protein
MTNFNGQHRYGAIDYTYWEAVKHQTLFTSIELAKLFTYASSSGIRTAVGKKTFPKRTIKCYKDNANGTNLWDNATITAEIERREKINQIMLKAIAEIQALAIA